MRRFSRSRRHPASACSSSTTARRTGPPPASQATPLASRWAFDVELIGRLLQGDPPLRPADFVEIPLQRWIDVSGSKIGPLQMVRTAWDLAVIAVRYHVRKRVP